MKNILFISLLLLAFANNLNAANPETIQGIEVLEMTADELAAYGVDIQGGAISYTEARLAPGSRPADTIFKKVVLDRRGINFRNPGPQTEITNIPPRYIIWKMPYGTQTYFRNLSDYKTMDQIERDSISEIHYYPGIDELVCVKPILGDDIEHEIYLWFEPRAEEITDSSETAPTSNIPQTNDPDLELIIYPNPATGNKVNLKISSSADCTINITLYEQSGSRIKDLATGMEISGSGEILNADISGMASGMYLIMMSDSDGNQIVKRLIINK